jgi:hypothetical protein
MRVGQPHYPAVQLWAVQLTGIHVKGVEVSLGVPVLAPLVRRSGAAVVVLCGNQELTTHEQGVEAHLDRQVIELGNVIMPRAVGALLPLLVLGLMLGLGLGLLPPLLQQPEHLVPDGRLVPALCQLDDLALHARRKLVPRLTIGPTWEVTTERIALISLVKPHRFTDPSHMTIKREYHVPAGLGQGRGTTP